MVPTESGSIHGAVDVIACKNHDGQPQVHQESIALNQFLQGPLKPQTPGLDWHFTDPAAEQVRFVGVGICCFVTVSQNPAALPFTYGTGGLHPPVSSPPRATPPPGGQVTLTSTSAQAHNNRSIKSPANTVPELNNQHGFCIESYSAESCCIM